eukprot:TRINITY_DN14539_c0_g1_i1.p1 TRINITY_DN14539_c0_g1~~TRINITY_DN14539_c0_g1_i1.p1  ORF type:complete len:445 (+),score=74.39 TRINITY_DN14539_c0_g1_i1:104-1438(+)
MQRRESTSAWEPRWEAPRRKQGTRRNEPRFEVAAWIGGPPAEVTSRVRSFYLAHGSAKDADFVEQLCNSYAGRARQLYRQLEHRYPSGKGFFTAWDAAENVLRRCDPGRLGELPGMFAVCGKGGQGSTASGVLTMLEKQYGVCSATRISKPCGDSESEAERKECCWRRLLLGMYRQHVPKMSAAAAATAIDSLLAVFEGREARLVTMLQRRFEGRELVAAVPSADTVLDCFTDLDNIIAGLCSKASECSEVVRREALRCDGLAGMVPPLVAAAESANTDAGARVMQVMAAAADRGGGCESLRQLQSDASELFEATRQNVADLNAVWCMAAGGVKESPAAGAAPQRAVSPRECAAAAARADARSQTAARIEQLIHSLAVSNLTQRGAQDQTSERADQPRVPARAVEQEFSVDGVGPAEAEELLTELVLAASKRRRAALRAARVDL